MTTKEFKIEGMSCHHCVMAVNKELSKLDLIDKRVQMGNASIDFDESKVTEKQITDAITEAGYKVAQ